MELYYAVIAKKFKLHVNSGKKDVLVVLLLYVVKILLIISTRMYKLECIYVE